MESGKNKSRRDFITKSLLAASGFTIIPSISFGVDNNIPLKISEPDHINSNIDGVKTVALICHAYYKRSHADVLFTKFFTGLPLDDGMVNMNVKVVSMHISQIGDEDIGVKIAKMNGVTLYPTVSETLTLGGDNLAVDAVIYTGEHGDYPYNRLGQKMYPRMNTLEQILRVFDASKKSVPVFSDKHLSYSWLDSKWIYDRAKELQVPMMAGSSLPYSYRPQGLEHPIGVKITEAVAIGYGTVDSYGFHATEVLQCMVERRVGGETGVIRVQGLQGDAVWAALDSGKISWDLTNAACDTISFRIPGSLRTLVKNPSALIVTYKDGLRAAIVMLTGIAGKRNDDLPPRPGGFAYAAIADGKTVATEFFLDVGLRSTHQCYLDYNINRMVQTGEPQAPFERNLLTSGIIDMGIRSMNEGKVKETPFLNINYSAKGYEPFLPTHPFPTNLVPWPPKGYEFLGWRK